MSMGELVTGYVLVQTLDQGHIIRACIKNQSILKHAF